MAQTLYDSNGAPVVLGHQIGSGGEGSILEVCQRPELVAKVYHRPVDEERAEKLLALIELQTSRLLKLTAWPIDTLHHQPGGNIAGFVMHKITGHRQVHMLYGVKDRLQEFPEANWPFLTHAATNIARAFAVIHEHSHVVGDINHASILVAPDATVKLIDCDSFQISHKGKTYLCRVGVTTHTPPELQGVPLGSLIRTVNHDAFGLAVIIFQLLFMGRHPYAGRYSRGDLTIEQAIREYRFAYAPTAAAYGMTRPPASLPLEAVSQPVARLFEAAFTPNTARPQATEWVKALTQLSRSLRQCDNNDSHYYLESLPACSWCKIEDEAGIILFNVKAPSVDRFNLPELWAQLPTLPVLFPPLPNRAVTVLPSAEAVELVRMRKMGMCTTSAICLAILAILALIEPALIGIGIWIASAICMYDILRRRSLAYNQLSQLKHELLISCQRSADEWRSHKGELQIHAKLRELQDLKTEYEVLLSSRQQRIDQVQEQARRDQLQKYLQSFKIANAKISGLGATRKAYLDVCGIQSAADLDVETLKRIPSFGNYFVNKLIKWRKSLEQAFQFDPKSMNLELQKVERDIVGKRLDLERRLKQGVRQLQEMVNQNATVRSSMRARLEVLELKLKEAEAGLKLSQTFSEKIGYTVALLPFVALFILALKSALLSEYKSAPSAQANLEKPQTPEPSLEERAKEYYLKGIDEAKRRRYNKAIQSYQQAIAIKEDFVEAYQELGDVLLKAGRYNEAVEVLEKSLLKQKSVQAYISLGVSYLRLDKLDKAEAAFQQAILLDSESADAYYCLGVVQERLQNSTAAKALFHSVINIDPNHSRALKKLRQLQDAENTLPESALPEDY